MVKPFLVQAGSARFVFVDPPAALYKFVDKEEYAQELVTRGTLKIGTLSEYRAKEGLDPARGDAGEGQFTITLESAQPETITAENAPWYLKEQVAAIGMPIFSHGGTINAAGNHPDSYVFCTSAAQTAALTTAYGPYCVRIDHIVGFFTALSRHLTWRLESRSRLGRPIHSTRGGIHSCRPDHRYDPNSIRATCPASRCRCNGPTRRRDCATRRNAS